MREIHEFRIFKDYYSLLPKPNRATFNGIVYVLKIPKEDVLFYYIEQLDKEIREKYGKPFFGFWNVNRTYTKVELAAAKIFHFNIKTAFEPAGEECGTIYDETIACQICGANRKQIGTLKLKKGSIPKKDIARTIAGEVVVSEKLANAFKQRCLAGMIYKPIDLGNKSGANYYQLIASSPELELTEKIVVGHNPFNLSTVNSEPTEFTVASNYKIKSEREVYKCPNGHTIGPKVLSEPYVFNSKSITQNDFFVSKQKVGVKKGLLRPEPLYFCSPAFRKLIEEEKLSGFHFEIANVE